MQKTSKLVQVSAVALAIASALTVSAVAKEGHKKHHAHYRAVTVHQVAAPAPDAFHNPAAPITAPVHIAGTVIGAPFMAASQIFPYQVSPAQNPLVLIGAPIHVVGTVLTAPFYVVNTAFGVPPAQPF